MDNNVLLETIMKSDVPNTIWFAHKESFILSRHETMHLCNGHKIMPNYRISHGNYVAR